MLKKTYKVQTISINKLFFINTLFNKPIKENDKELVKCNVKIKNYNNKNILFEQPNFLIRHKSNKEKWKINTNKNFIKVTNDHSIMVIRNNKLIKEKAENLLLTDKLININNKKVNIKNVKQLSNYKNNYVYDIEMQNNHTFFANNLLVHNTDSVYFSIENVIDDLVSRKLLPPKYENDIIQFILDLVEFRLSDYIDQGYNSFAKKYGVDNLQKFELENILYNVIFLAKKKYVGDLGWTEGAGKLERNTKLKITGIEIIQSSTPKFCRITLKSLINYIFEHINNFNITDFLNELNKYKQAFKAEPIENISYSKSIGNYEKFILEDKQEFKIASGCPFHVRGAGYHNYIINSSPIYKNKYKQIKTSDKIKMYYANDDFCNSFAYLSGNYPYEIAPEINIDLQFSKSIIDPMNRLLKALHFAPISSDLVTTKALF